MRLGRGLAILLVAVITLGGCAGPGTGQSGRAPAGPEPGAKKSLTLAHILEPADLGGFTGAAGSSGAGPIKNIIHDSLSVADDAENRHPQLATEMPSTDRGTWRLNPDGSMDVTWKLRPNVKWHDGTAFSSADLLFSFEVYRDPELPTASASTIRLMESATAPDPQTLVIHWSKTYVRAHEASGLTPLPKHLLEQAYRSDRELFVNGPHFRDRYVGLGAYKLVKWEPGSHFETTRFDDYYLGRPPLDTVYLRFVFDANTMVANVLAGTVDVVLPPSVDVDTALELRRRWEGTGNQALIVPNGDRIHFMEIQYRPQYARPRNGLPNLQVRQAMYQATDRQALTDVVIGGLGPVADSWIHPNHQFRAQLERAIPKYPHDPARAQQLLTQAGWTRGPDGILAHSSGERFESEIWARQGAGGQEKEPSIVADQWKAVGANVTPYVVPAARESDREYQSTLPMAIISGNLGANSWYTDRLHSQFVAAEENRWSGRNKLGYVNPKADPLFDRLQVTVDERQQIDLHRQLIESVIADLAFFPLYWEVIPVLTVKGVKLSSMGARNMGRFFEWNKE